ncbi:hypothetical protein [Nonomuraea sp. NPDC049625]|uniref:hypothetical protein n=1 Tax=Nonomuraea sp. NPDC049625 TaxID=3155775 RepID=UPI00343DE222
MRSKEERNLQPDEFVDHISGNRQIPPDVQAFAGFLGRAPEQGHWRLFLSADLTEFLEFEERDLVHHTKIDPAASILGGTVIWLRRDATVRHTRLDTHQAQLEFLVGNITTGHLGGTLGAVVARKPGGGGIKSIPPQASVCIACPTGGGEHTCVPAVCTLATGCLTQVPTDSGCRR